MKKLKKSFSIMLCISIIISCFVGIAVKAEEPTGSKTNSSNADLASIKVSDGTLTPEFDPDVTEYNVIVKYDVKEITITGSVADGTAIYTGGGTFAIKVGANSRTLTVTAENGSKKSYTVNIKRMTKQETNTANDEERSSDPLFVVIDGKDYTIVNDPEQIIVPKGYEMGTTERKDEEIIVLNDKHGKYQLYWLVDENNQNGAFYTRDENDKFTRVNCINAGGNLYIIEHFDIGGALPTGYVLSDRVIDGVKLDVYGFTDEALKDFYIVKCYVDGKTGYYCFDSTEATMQRAITFELALSQANNPPADVEEEPKNKTDLVLLYALLAAILILIAAVVIVIIIASNRKRYNDDNFVSIADSDFLAYDSTDINNK